VPKESSKSFRFGAIPYLFKSFWQSSLQSGKNASEHAEHRGFKFAVPGSVRIVNERRRSVIKGERRGGERRGKERRAS